MRAHEIYNMATHNQVIQAIKEVRQMSCGLGLKEAKDVIDAAKVLPPAQGVAHIAKAIGEVPQTKIVTKRAAEVRAWNNALEVQALVDGDKLVIADGDGYRSLTFNADLLPSIIEALQTLVVQPGPAVAW
jgi:hypothetical protein